MYGENPRVLNDFEREAYNLRIAESILKQAGIKPEARLISLSMKEMNEILKVIQDYKHIDNETEDFSTDFSKFKDSELDKAVFEFIAQSQNAGKDLATKKEKIRAIKKMTMKQKLVDEKILDIKERYENMSNHEHTRKGNNYLYVNSLLPIQIHYIIIDPW